MTPYEQCFDELGLQAPTIEHRRALWRLVAAMVPDRTTVERATLEVAEQRKRCREDDARVDVLRNAVEAVLALPRVPRPIERRLQDAMDATAYDGRTAREIVRAAGEVT
jgi:hypothetical protein